MCDLLNEPAGSIHWGSTRQVGNLAESGEGHLRSRTPLGGNAIGVLSVKVEACSDHCGEQSRSGRSRVIDQVRSNIVDAPSRRQRRSSPLLRCERCQIVDQGVPFGVDEWPDTVHGHTVTAADDSRSDLSGEGAGEADHRKSGAGLDPALDGLALQRISRL